MTTAIILAGGLGTRLRGTVPDVPKPMAPIGGRPFLELQLDYWIAQGVERFVLSVGYRHESITDHFGKSYRGITLDYAIEEVPLGTGGGLLLAAQMLPRGQAFLLLNGDTYFQVELPLLRAFHDEHQADLTVAAFQASESGRYMGMDVAPDGRIVGLKSSSACPGPLANGGVYWVEANALRAGSWEPGAKLSFEADILPTACSAGLRLYAHECKGKFIDIGVPHDYLRAPAFFAA